MRAVYRKELRQYFCSMVGYVYLAIFLLLSGYYFVAGNLLAGSGDIRNYFSSIVLIVMFLIPMLTMRSFAEERKMRTDQLLMASPISCAGIVWGKFCAILTVVAMGFAIIPVYAVVLAAFGQFDGMVLLGNCVGMLLAAGAFIAVGMLISCVTENQMVAGVVSYSILMGLWLAGYAGSFVQSPVIKAVTSYLSLSGRFGEFAMGIFSITSITYYLSICALFLFAATVVQENRRAG